MGQKIENTILEILELSLKATRSPKEEKLTILTNTDTKVNLLKILIRLSNETKSLDNKKYIALQEKLQEIGRMIGGWLKYNIR